MIDLPLRTERLVIRPLRLEDAEALHELYADREAMRYLTDAVPATIAESRAWVQAKIERFDADDGFSLWALEEEDAVVGDGGLQREDFGFGPVLDLACRLVPRHQGRGLALEASRAMLAAAPEGEDVVAVTHVDHRRARAVLERLGGRHERDFVADWNGRPMALYRFERPSAAR